MNEEMSWSGIIILVSLFLSVFGVFLFYPMRGNGKIIHTATGVYEAYWKKKGKKK